METNAKAGDECIIVLDRTNFYPESGGQACDKGAFKNLQNPNLEFQITNVVHVQGFSFHVGKVVGTNNEISGFFNINDTVECLVDKKFRYNTTLNHTGL